MPWSDLPILSVGQVLTAAHMNAAKDDINIGHRVCTSTTRPPSPDEGTMIYETDTGRVMVWNGSVWSQVGTETTPVSGTLVQMQSGFTSTQVSITTATRTDTGLAATITPKFSSSKIVIQAQLSTRRPSGGNAGMGFDIRRNGTVVMNQANNYYIYNSADVSGGTPAVLYHVDSPAATTALEYRVYFSSYSTSPAEVQDDSAYRSYIILWEVA